MEETVANVHLKVDELHHCDITPLQSVCKEIKNAAVTAEEMTENPEYVILRKSIAVQTVTNEEVVIPKQNPALNQRSNSTVFSPEGGNTMEIDVSSQESAMDIASQESLSAKESNSGESYCGRAFASSREEAVLMREEALRKREEAVLAGEEDLRKRKEAVAESQEKVKIFEEVVADRKRSVLQMEKEIQEHEQMLNNREAQLAKQELELKKLETVIKIRELEAEGYEVIPLSSESCRCLPRKRAKKN